jgi:hypothetical protein
MRRTLVAFILSLGLSACGGVVEEATPDEEAASSGPRAMEWCYEGDQSCETLQGQSCRAGTTTPCCQSWGRETCICPKSLGYWMCPM